MEKASRYLLQTHIPKCQLIKYQPSFAETLQETIPIHSIVRCSWNIDLGMRNRSVITYRPTHRYAWVELVSDTLISNEHNRC